MHSQITVMLKSRWKASPIWQGMVYSDSVFVYQDLSTLYNTVKKVRSWCIPHIKSRKLFPYVTLLSNCAKILHPYIVSSFWVFSTYIFPIFFLIFSQYSLKIFFYFYLVNNCEISQQIKSKQNSRNSLPK